MMDGWQERASSKRRRSWRSASPTHLERQSAPLRMKNAGWWMYVRFKVCGRGCGETGDIQICLPPDLQLAARALATRVFPVPGGP